MQYLHELSVDGKTWYVKLSDRFHIGLPDVIGCYRGKLFAVELKAVGRSPRLIQKITLAAMKKAGGSVGWFDDFDKFKQFIRGIIYGKTKNNRKTVSNDIIES